VNQNFEDIMILYYDSYMSLVCFMSAVTQRCHCF